MVTIEVGPEKTKYQLFKDHLCTASPYFERALNGGMIEAGNQSISLPHVDVDTFECFCYWLHTCKIPKFVSETLSKSMIELWLFGDAHEIYGLMNDTSDAMIEAACTKLKTRRAQFNSHMLHVIYGNTLPSSPLRKLFVDLALHLPELRWLRSDLSGEYPDEYLDDVLDAQLDMVRGESLLDLNGRTKLALVLARILATYNVDRRLDFPAYKVGYHVALTPTTS